MAYLNARKAQLAVLAGVGYAERYRQRAETWRNQSESVEDPHLRSIFLRLAALYQDMADQFAVGHADDRSRSPKSLDGRPPFRGLGAAGGARR